MDWRWIGGGEVEGVGGRVAVVVDWGSDEWQWQSNYHTVIGGIYASTSSLFITHRAFSCCRASSRCSDVGLDVNVFGGLDASLSLSCRRASSRRSIVISIVVNVVIVGLDVDVIRGFDESSKLFDPPPRLLPLLCRCCHRCCRRRYHHCCHSLFCRRRCCHCTRRCSRRCRRPCHRHRRSVFIVVVAVPSSSLLSLSSSMCLADCYICRQHASVAAITFAHPLRHHPMLLSCRSLLHRCC